MRGRRQVFGGGQTPRSSLVENELGSGSDYTVFLNFLGVPVVSMSFDGPYGVYHSQYDDLYWMEHFGDPGYRYMTAMVEVWGRLGLRLANAEVIPLRLPAVCDDRRRLRPALREVPQLQEKLDLSGLASGRRRLGERGAESSTEDRLAY